MDLDLPEIGDTASPASMSAHAEPGGYVVQSGARAGQTVSQFPTDLLKAIAKGGAKDPGGDSTAFSEAVHAELDRRVASVEAQQAPVAGRRIADAPAPVQRAAGVSADMPLPCGHPASMLERLEGEMFMSKCRGCERLDELEEAVRGLAPRLVGKIMWEVRAWERKHHSPKESA